MHVGITSIQIKEFSNTRSSKNEYTGRTKQLKIVVVPFGICHRIEFLIPKNILAVLEHCTFILLENIERNYFTPF